VGALARAIAIAMRTDGARAAAERLITIDPRESS
jgi:hypothetical protein